MPGRHGDRCMRPADVRTGKHDVARRLAANRDGTAVDAQDLVIKTFPRDGDDDVPASHPLSLHLANGLCDPSR